jgi:glycosyltransferase involved in cell wall biosynthesis
MPLSIITAVHNSLPMNELFWECLSTNTTSEFELIIIDNHSTDGSEKFFESLSRSFPEKLVYLRSPVNQSYPVSQNQGMTVARHETLCFLNNDLWLPYAWNDPIEKALEKEPFLVVSPSGQEAQPTQKHSDTLKARWKRICFISRIWRAAFGKSEKERLWKSVEWMYGNLEDFQSPTPDLVPGYFPGIKGDAVCFTKKLVKEIGFHWDERIEAADWHLYLHIASLHEKRPEIPLPRVLLSTYAHHFGRYSARQEFEPLQLEEPFLKIEDVWPREVINRLWWGNRLPRA